MPTVKDYVDALNEFLLRTHAVRQNNVLIIDEAQNLSVRRAGAAAPADQPRDQRAQAAADHPDRPAGAARDAGTARHGAARAARDRPLPPRGADGTGDRALRQPSPERRRDCARPIPSISARCGASSAIRAACRAASTCCAIARCSAPTRTASPPSTAASSTRRPRKPWMPPISARSGARATSERPSWASGWRSARRWSEWSASR